MLRWILLVRWIALLSLLALAAASCAPLHRQVAAYPAAGQPPPQIAADMGHCETWAKAVAADPGASTAVGAGVGAVVGGGVGAVFGAVVYALFGLDPGEGAKVGAALGGLTGAVTGASASGDGAVQSQQHAYAACMTARGYVVAR